MAQKRLAQASSISISLLQLISRLSCPIGARLETLLVQFGEGELSTSLDLAYSHIVGDTQMKSQASMLG
jgi:hypothetical protein